MSGRIDGLPHPPVTAIELPGETDVVSGDRISVGLEIHPDEFLCRRILLTPGGRIEFAGNVVRH